MSTAVLKHSSTPAGGMHPPPSPGKFFETLHAYQRAGALKAAIELDLFTAVGEKLKTVPELAKRASASERNIRALSDYMAILGFLTKVEGRYGLTADSAVFLDKKSTAYVGSATQFMASPVVTDGFRDLTAAVRSGRPLSDEAFTKDEHPAWAGAEITGKGHIATFDFCSGLGIEQSAVQEFDMELKNLNGMMSFQWQAAKKSPGPHSEDNLIKLPAAVSIPLAQYLSGMPLSLEVSSALIVKPGIAGAELSKKSFRITYDGYQSLQTKEGNIDANGSVSGTIDFAEPQNLASTALMGLGVAFAAPRIELSFETSKLFKMDDIKEGAEKVDKPADQLAKRLLDPDQYEAFKSGPMGRFSHAKAADNALQSDAAAYFEMVSSSRNELLVSVRTHSLFEGRRHVAGSSGNIGAGVRRVAGRNAQGDFQETNHQDRSPWHKALQRLGERVSEMNLSC